MNFKTFKYFLECYFNPSANYDELDKLIVDFNSFENVGYRKKLHSELLVLQLEEFSIMQEFVRKYGMRKMDDEKLKWLIQRMLDKLELS